MGFLVAAIGLMTHLRDVGWASSELEMAKLEARNMALQVREQENLNNQATRDVDKEDELIQQTLLRGIMGVPAAPHAAHAQQAAQAAQDAAKAKAAQDAQDAQDRILKFLTARKQKAEDRKSITEARLEEIRQKEQVSNDRVTAANVLLTLAKEFAETSKQTVKELPKLFFSF